MEKEYNFFERKQLLLDTMLQQFEVYSVPLFNGLRILLKIEIIKSLTPNAKDPRKSRKSNSHMEEIKLCG